MTLCVVAYFNINKMSKVMNFFESKFYKILMFIDNRIFSNLNL
jgi:hypothetical protein